MSSTPIKPAAPFYLPCGTRGIPTSLPLPLMYLQMECRRQAGHQGSHRGMIEFLDSRTGEWLYTIKGVWK